jgi:alpha-beta hydrolase superfamily lysophospholipase
VRRGVVHVAHGLAEHGARYARLAEELTGRGFAVCANDHRGHGKSAARAEDLGYFGDAAGIESCADDLASMIETWRCEWPGVPVVLLGHSMGSFITLRFLSRHSELIDGVVLSGSNGKVPPFFGLLRGLIRFERWRLGKRSRSKLVDKLAFGDMNRRFEPGRTQRDWLSRDPQEVDKYIADPFCGFVATTQLWYDLAQAMKWVENTEALGAVRNDLPIYLFAGSDDPINDHLRGLERLVGTLRRAGLTDIEQRFYPEGRHEMLNDINRDEVTADLVEWLERKCDTRAAAS